MVRICAPLVASQYTPVDADPNRLWASRDAPSSRLWLSRIEQVMRYQEEMDGLHVVQVCTPQNPTPDAPLTRPLRDYMVAMLVPRIEERKWACSDASAGRKGPVAMF